MRSGYYGMDGLKWQLRDYQMENTWREYVATMVYALGKARFEHWKFPSYVSIVHPDIARKDNRSGAEILQSLKKRLESG